MENSYNMSKDMSSSNKTLSQNSKMVKGIISPPTNLFKTEINRKDFDIDGYNTNSNKHNNRLKFEKFEFDIETIKNK